MKQDLFRLLQLFADGGDGGAGDGAASGDAGAAASTVVETADDGRAKLLALGVPPEKLRDGRNYSAKGKPRAEQKQAAAAQQESTQANEGAEPTLAELIKQKPAYNAELQKMFQQRVGKAKQAEDGMEELQPALQKYMQDNNLDPAKTDMRTLAKHMLGEYRDKAMELGVSEDQAMEMDVREKRANEQQTRQHVDGLMQQAQDFRKIIPNFDLAREIRDDPQFRKLTSPQVGMSVEQAYWALHHDDMVAAVMHTTQSKTQEMVSNAIQSGSRRPVENGANATAPSQNIQKSYRDMSPEERTAFKRARGLPV